MIISSRRSPRGVSLVCAAFAAGTFAVAALTPATVRAQAQDAAQQGCINALLKAGAKVGKTQGKASSSCIKAEQLQQDTKLGAPGQDLNVDACLTNDPKGKMAKTVDKVAAAEASKCTTAPAFGFAGSAKTANTAQAQSRGMLRDMFGPNLSELVLFELAYDDEAGLACHPDMVKAMNKLYDTLWKEMTSAAKNALSGKNVTQVTSGAELATALTTALAADEKGKIAKAADALSDAVDATCETTTQPIVEILRGACVAEFGQAQISACAVASTRCRFCRAMAGATATTIDCDSFDDSLVNDSCVGAASAREITSSGELITGPLASGKIGDYIMENDYARFVIQDVGQRDLYSVGAFGGNIIDAEVAGNPGLDNFLEMQPAINIETVINATSIEIVNDGSDGSAAVIRTCGPDDLLDFVNPSTVIEDAGFAFPPEANDNNQDVEGCTEYTLEPDASYLKLATTLTNNEAATLPLFVGDWVNAAGELEQWASSSDAGIGVRLISSDMGVLSYFGYGEAAGVDYGITTTKFTGSNAATSIFSTSGVSYILHSQDIFDAIINQTPEFDVAAGQSKTYTRYFGVGDGSGANMKTLENLVKGTLSGTVSGCVTVNGVPAPGARVSIGPKPAATITRVTSTWVTGADGCYSGTVAVGNYGMAAYREGTPHEGGGSSPTVHAVTVSATVPLVQDFDLPQTGAVSVTVTDEDSVAVPARVTVVGFDPSPEPTFGGSTGLFRDQSDQHPFGVVRAIYTDSSGTVTFDHEPGSYQIYVSRGGEYSLYSAPLTVTAGVTTNVVAQIARVVDTTGFISSDHHVHGIASADSRVSDSDRVRQYAGEGVDNIIMTDHHSHTDLTPTISALGYTSFITSTIGEEITTWDTGHYNAYPLTVDPNRPSGGSTDWAGAAPAGFDFPSENAYGLDPVDIYDLAKNGATSTPDTVVQINHIDSHFEPMQINTSLVPPQSSLSAAGKLNFRMDPASGNLFHLFDALELWNGDNRSHQNQFLNERIGVWFNLLNQGLEITAITDTDTHNFFNLDAAGSRTWAASSTDAPASISPGEMAQSIEAGRAVGGQGIYVQARLVDADDALNVADFSIGGSTLLDVTNPVSGVNLEIDVQAPLWAEFDTIRVYANAATASIPARPYLYTATPTDTLLAGVDFTVTTNNVEPGVPGGSRREASVSIPFTNLTEDTWFVVVVKGSDSVSRPMFPVYPANLQQSGNGTLPALIDGNLGQSGVTALGFTNALYADVDGNPGFDGPLEP